MILDKKLTVDKVATRIIEEYEDFLNVMFSDENAQQLVLRLRCDSNRCIRVMRAVLGAGVADVLSVIFSDEKRTEAGAVPQVEFFVYCCAGLWRTLQARSNLGP